ncbi:MAG: hypothetical protein VXZ36_09855, partial [Pseudomonadota bacterium]|nr:hypothetical protein [Pseudomonadota bacterium]
AFIALAFLSASASSTTLPLEYFTKHGDYLDLKLSPDGKHIAAIQIAKRLKIKKPLSKRLIWMT